jgi:hypothetical protein
MKVLLCVALLVASALGAFDPSQAEFAELNNNCPKCVKDGHIFCHSYQPADACLGASQASWCTQPGNGETPADDAVRLL